MRVYPKFSHTSRSHIFQLLSIRSNFKIFRLSDAYILYKSIQGHPLWICLCQLEFLSKLCFLTWTIPCRELIFPIAFRGGVYPDDHREWTWVWLKKKKIQRKVRYYWKKHVRKVYYFSCITISQIFLLW